MNDLLQLKESKPRISVLDFLSENKKKTILYKNMCNEACQTDEEQNVIQNLSTFEDVNNELVNIIEQRNGFSILREAD